MHLDLDGRSLPVYEALASGVRLHILRLLSERELNITQLAEQLGLSKAITAKHVQKLEEARLLRSTRVPGRSGMKKLPRLAVDDIHIHFPTEITHSYSVYTTQVRVGHYSNFDVRPTCGLATAEGVVGRLDDPFSFVDPQRVDAALLWFSEGFVEYKIPNNLSGGQQPEVLEISLELASEFPQSNNVWPSDITFLVNGVAVGAWTCPGNYSDVRGFFTPPWWDDNSSQYGLLKHLRVSRVNSNMDGELLSDVGLDRLSLRDSRFIDLRIAVLPGSEHVGGVTLFGKGFGNHDQDITVKLYYTEP